MPRGDVFAEKYSAARADEKQPESTRNLSRTGRHIALYATVNSHMLGAVDKRYWNQKDFGCIKRYLSEYSNGGFPSREVA